MPQRLRFVSSGPSLFRVCFHRRLPFPSSSPCPEDPTIVTANAGSADGVYITLRTGLLIRTHGILCTESTLVESHILHSRLTGTPVGNGDGQCLQGSEKYVEKQVFINPASVHLQLFGPISVTTFWGPAPRVDRTTPDGTRRKLRRRSRFSTGQT